MQERPPEVAGKKHLCCRLVVSDSEPQQFHIRMLGFMKTIHPNLRAEIGDGDNIVQCGTPEAEKSKGPCEMVLITPPACGTSEAESFDGPCERVGARKQGRVLIPAAFTPIRENKQRKALPRRKLGTGQPRTMQRQTPKTDFGSVLGRGVSKKTKKQKSAITKPTRPGVPMPTKPIRPGTPMNK